ncbi:PAS domain S-box-containing protein [Paenibacillus sp. yr247]|uniref:ATP-binding protein n=1 Tax=Paenibacillus sp. yr247 TaxID=1761880 RepID=UPI000882735C|nr:ATP-binding protein [Paenibacillus sp. yr247]SDN99532.1 PAS domain S-box-containing protein [Paenibacillus sp. yr247]
MSIHDPQDYMVSIEEMRKLFNLNVQTGMLVVDEDGKIILATDQILKFSGYSAEEITQISFPQLFKVRATLRELYEFYFKNESSLVEWPHGFLVGKNGETIFYQFSMLKLMRGDKLTYLLAMKHQEEYPQLNLLQRFSDAFLKDINLGVLLISMNFTLVDVSDRACQILAMDREHILNKSLEEIFATVPSQHQLVQRTILDGAVVRNHAVSWTNNQERFELLLDSNVLKDSQGKIVGAYVIFKDVTNMRSLEEMVQRSDRLAMIGQIAAGTAHEIRNPLTSIKGFLQVLRRTFEVQGMEKEQSYTVVMLEEIDRINELVNEFLLLSKPKHVSYERIDVTEVLRGILPIINNEAILYNVHLQYEASYHLPEVIADKELLKQVFLNVCKNGIEAMADGGTLTISEKVDTVERNVSIDIHDTGSGIPMFVIDKIFDPFFTTKDTGTGLGLSVCQRIIHDMGGTIRVSSKGFGTTFTISIPYA